MELGLKEEDFYDLDANLVFWFLNLMWFSPVKHFMFSFVSTLKNCNSQLFSLNLTANLFKETNRIEETRNENENEARMHAHISGQRELSFEIVFAVAVVVVVVAGSLRNLRKWEKNVGNIRTKWPSTGQQCERKRINK